MTDPRDRIDELQKLAQDMPYGPTQVALLEEAAQLADSVQDADLAFRARFDLIVAAHFSARPDIALVSFSWCLAEYDRNPKDIYKQEVLWAYKWVFNCGLGFPEITRSCLEDLLGDMERRFREAGSTLFAVAKLRRSFQMHIGDREAARVAHTEFRKRRRDFLSDCIACDADSMCKYYCFQRHWGRAVQTSQPVLRGRFTCAEQPHCILSGVLLPLLHLGRVEEAKAYQRQGYRLVREGKQFLGQHAEHLQFLVLVGDWAQAKRVLERHLPDALDNLALHERFQFWLAARLWTDRVARGGTRALKVRLPQGLPTPNADGKWAVDALGEWFTAQAREIAQRFDARNGTDAFQRQIDELPDLLRLAVT